MTGYRYNTLYNPNTIAYSNYNTSAGGVSGLYQPNIRYSPNYMYPYNSYYTPYSTPYYSTPYYAPYYTPYFPRYRWGHFGGGHCAMNVSLKTMDASEARTIEGETLRAETFGPRTEIEYGSEDEKLNFLSTEDGKTFASGKVFIEGQLVRINPATQKCTSTRTLSEENPENQLAKFDCSDGNLSIKAEVLIPVSKL